jgi:hypothetical protein
MIKHRIGATLLGLTLITAPVAASGGVAHAIAPTDARGTGTIASGASPAAVAATGGSTQLRGTDRSLGGQAALDHLGTRIDGLAAASGLDPASLRRQVLQDHTLRVSPRGDLLVADVLGGTGATVTTGSSNTLIWPIDSTLRLHSNPNSPRKIYLDFNGHTTTGTQWNSSYNVGTISTPVWGRDSDPTTFSTSEAAAIQQSFASVSEDFAPFDVDITTEDPGIDALRRTSSTDSQYGIRVVVGINNWLNVTNSGIAYIGSFTWDSDTPAFCFAGSTTPTKQIAECISHETGHTVGLYHDGTTNGSEYYGGHNNWAPIMGNSYGRPVTQWSAGEYPYANNSQNDLSVIGGYLGWLVDDFVGTTATTATLPAATTRTGRISYGTGELDAFKFSMTSTRTVNVQAWEYYQAVDPNLNLRVRITNSSGVVLATSSPSDSTRTNSTITLGTGTYYVFVDGVGEGTTSTGYTNYASMGIYNLYLQFV